MTTELLLGVACALLGALVALLLLRRSPQADRLASQVQDIRMLAEQALAGQREVERALSAELGTLSHAVLRDGGEARALLETRLGTLSTSFAREQGEARALLETKLREMAEQSALRLGDIQRSVNEQLHVAVEKQMQGSFQRVIDQFAQVQKAMGDVQAMTAGIGDLKRIFTNVKTRGAWGEMHLRALLEDVLPHGGWEANRKLRADSDDIVEFAVVMPMKGGHRPLLAIDAKFPSADYDRLLLAAESGDADGERLARRGLETVLRGEARKIGSKYINPPVTVDFAVMYLPTDGLYVEAARMPGLIEEMNRDHRVLVMGPSLAPALLRTIHLGVLTLSLEQKAEEIQRLLGATRTEMGRMDMVLEKLGKQAGTFSNTIELARRRTRAVNRQLRSVTLMETAQADTLLELEAAIEDEEPPENA